MDKVKIEKAMKKLEDSVERLRLAHEDFLRAFEEARTKQKEFRREILNLADKHKVKQTLEKILSFKPQ